MRKAIAMGFRLCLPPAAATLLVALSTHAHAAPPILARDLMIAVATPALDYKWRLAPEAAQPALFARMRGEGDRDFAQARASAQRDHADGSVRRPYVYRIDWTDMSYQSSRLLALAGRTMQDTGGAHPNSGYAAMIWDKTTHRTVPFAQMFTDWPAAQRLLGPVLCEALQRERAARRQGAKLGGDFDACPKVSEAVLVPWGDYGAVRAIYSPYVAGPYSEGSYDLKIGLPETLKPLTRAPYRAALFGAQ